MNEVQTGFKYGIGAIAAWIFMRFFFPRAMGPIEEARTNNYTITKASDKNDNN